MKQKRSKAYRKYIAYYAQNYKFREPFQVLVDAEFCTEAAQQKMDVPARMHSVIQSRVKLMVTQCTMHKLYSMGPAAQPAVDLAKTFERRKCGHHKPVDEYDCLHVMAGPDNRHRYLYATQAKDMRMYLRGIPGCPILFVSHAVLLMEPPSEASQSVSRAASEARLHMSDSERRLLEGEGNGDEVHHAPLPKKRKKAKGPNPLSVKKGKTDKGGKTDKRDKTDNTDNTEKRGSDTDEGAPKKKRKRSHKPKASSAD